MFAGALFIFAASVTLIGVTIAAARVVFARRTVAATGPSRFIENVATGCVWIGGFVSFYTAPFFLVALLVNPS